MSNYSPQKSDNSFKKSFRALISGPVLIIGTVFFLLNSFVPAVNAQDDKTKEQLAVQYYQDEAYEKALSLFEDLFENNPHSPYIYEYYLNTLIALEDYREAEKTLEKLIRKNEKTWKYRVDLGYIYSLRGENNHSEKVFKKILKDLPQKPETIRLVANYFLKHKLHGYAIKTYLEGRSVLHNTYAFTVQLARLYRQEQQYENMFEEYLSLVTQRPQELEYIKNELQDLVLREKLYNKFREMLLQKIQRDPGHSNLVDLLSWLFIQNKEFHTAFIQLKALDKRLDEGEKRLLMLAGICIDNRRYKTAEDIYRYILDKGRDQMFYYRARKGLLDVQYKKITVMGEYNREDLLELEKAYEKFIEQNYFNYNAISSVIRKLGKLKAIYLDQEDEAIKLLEKFIERAPNIDQAEIAKIKLDLGDYYILKDDVWEATLYYSQVEKMFKDHPLGHEAKFKNAKLSFYRGDFEWALAQLKVLKGSTSELIANDALNLSLLIKDNRGLDTTEKPLLIYSRADFYIFKGKYGEALSTLDTILNRYPGHSLEDEIYFARGKIMFRQKKYQKAIDNYRKVFENFSGDLLADDALYKAARIYEVQLKNPSEALKLYEKLILNHKGSVFHDKAREAYRELKKTGEQTP